MLVLPMHFYLCKITHLRRTFPYLALVRASFSPCLGQPLVWERELFSTIRRLARNTSFCSTPSDTDQYYNNPGLLYWPTIAGVGFNDGPIFEADANSFEYLLRTRKFNPDDTITLSYYETPTSTEPVLSNPISARRDAYSNFGYV